MLKLNAPLQQNSAYQTPAVTMCWIFFATEQCDAGATGVVDEALDCLFEGSGFGDAVVADVALVVIKLCARWAAAEGVAEEEIFESVK